MSGVLLRRQTRACPLSCRLMNFVSRPTGGIISDLLAKRFGIRGRIFWLWFSLTIGGCLCIGVGVNQGSFAKTMVIIIFFSYFIQARPLPPNPLTLTRFP